MRLRVYLPESTFEWESPGTAFRVGRGDTCALRFEGESAKFASWEHAEFSRDYDGAAYVTDLASSNGTYVDDSRITGPTALGVGAVVQIGRAGPRLEVLTLAPTVARPVPIRDAGVAPAAERPSTAARVPTTSSQPSPAVAVPQARRHSARPRHKAGAGLVLLGFAGLVIVGGLYLASRAGPEHEPPSRPKVAQAKPGATQLNGTQQNGQPKTNRSVKKRPAPKPPEPETVLPPAPAADQPALAAYRLIVVEDPQAQASWPLAGAVVVGERALLTTATVALELGKYIERGFNVSVMRPPQGERTRVIERRVHAAFQQADAAEQLFFDAALLYTDELLADIVPLASADELDQLERGQPVTCIAVEHDFDAIDRFQPLDAKTYAGKIFAVTGLPPQPGPRLLHVRGPFSDKSAGSPIVNERGRLIALYCEPAPSEGATAGLALHYAKVIELDLLEQGLSKPDDSIWVPVRTVVQTQEKEK